MNFNLVTFEIVKEKDSAQMINRYREMGLPWSKPLEIHA